jgi:uncharacterized membrane protein
VEFHSHVFCVTRTICHCVGGGYSTCDSPVFVYAAVIVLVNVSYHAFAYEVVPGPATGSVQNEMRRKALSRSLLTLALFAVATLLSLKVPLIAFAVVTCVLLTYARPEIPGVPDF